MLDVGTRRAIEPRLECEAYADQRVDDITGDLGGAKPLANWGLHLIDVNLAMGNLLELVEAQSKAYRARR